MGLFQQQQQKKLLLSLRIKEMKEQNHSNKNKILLWILSIPCLRVTIISEFVT